MPGATALTRMPSGPELDRGRAHQADEPGLGRAVGGVAGRGGEPRRRGHEDHDAAAGVAQGPTPDRHGQIGVAQDDVVVPVPQLVVHVEQAAVLGHAHDVDDAAEARWPRSRPGAPGASAKSRSASARTVALPDPGHPADLGGDVVRRGRRRGRRSSTLAPAWARAWLAWRPIPWPAPMTTTPRPSMRSIAG